MNEHRPDCACGCLFNNGIQPEQEEITPAPPEKCSLCGTEVEFGMWPAEWCRGKAEAHGNGWKQHIFPTVEVDLGKDGKVRISGVMDVRRLEKESERRASNGEGQLLVWREFSQDRSNRDRNAIGENNQISPRDFKRRAHGKITTRRRGDYQG